jgi:hypothetical protein
MHPHLKQVPLRHGDALVLPDRQIEFVYFMEKGLASTIAESAPEAPVEVGMTGCEGLVSIPIVLGSDRAPFRVVVQGPGEALRVTADDLRRIVVARPQVQDCLLRYIQSFLVQISQTAAANARFSTRQRPRSLAADGSRPDERESASADSRVSRADAGDEARHSQHFGSGA